MPTPKRRPIPRDVQVRVFRNDRWLCHMCRMPVLFDPALRLLERFVADRAPGVSLAYYDLRRSRDRSPLLDQLGVAVDHVHAHAKGGAHDESNFRTACNKCNNKKGDQALDDHKKRAPTHTVKGSRGEPKSWDGLSTLFLVLAEEHPEKLTASERAWVTALTNNS